MKSGHALTDRVGYLKRFYSHKFLCSVLICIIIGLIVSVVTGFRFEYYTNDDYQMSNLFKNGEVHNLLINFFLSSVLSFVQQQITFINVFTVLQQICCLFSSVIVVYVLLKKLDAKFALLLSAMICSFIFVSDVLIIQFSQTPVVICVAGVVLAYYASLFETRRKYKLFQLIVSGSIIVIASLFRFTPFGVSAGFAFLFLICVICSNICGSKKSEKFLSGIICSIRKCISLILVIAISFSSAFCLYIFSEIINSSDSSYSKFVEYNNARSRIDDYETAPYEGHEAFYNSVGINSNAELTLFRFDKNKYDAQTLNKIADYSEKVIQGGDSKPVYAIKKAVKRFYNSTKDIYRFILSVKEKINIPISNVLFLFFCVIILIGIAAFILIVHKKKKPFVKSNKNRIRQIFGAFIVISWAVFFLITRIMFAQITNHNFLFIPLFLIVLTAFFIDKAQNGFAYLVFSLAPMGLYLYQDSFRMSYRVSFSFLFPAVIFMLVLIEYPKDNASNNKIVKYVSYSTVLAGLALCTVWCVFRFYPQYSLYYDMKLRDYIEESNNTFIVGTSTNACVDEGYYNSMLPPSIPENEIMLAWSNSSDYFENDLKDRQIQDILLDSINSDMRLVLKANEGTDLDEQKQTYEDYYNIHYFNGNKRIKLEIEKQFKYDVYCDNPERSIRKVGVYKVVE